MNDDLNRVTYFAETDSRNRRMKFGIKKNDRAKHTYVIGKTGMGKSTLLENLAIQDIQNGEGLAFIDPHGNTADLLLEYVPEHRIKDVLYFAPFDMEYPVSFNVMEDIGAERRHLVVNGLMSAFKKIWADAWSARMEYILNNIMLALLEYPGSTLLGVNRMLADKDFRKKVVENITDPSVRSFWVDEYANYTERFAQDAAPAIQNKVGQFVTNPLVRNIIGQSNSTFNIRKMMDEKKILIINLSKGRVGESNANLLGSMLVTKIYLAAMSRADANEAELAKLPNFYLYVDEFQSFANESFADILSEARKYKLNLTIAHQYIDQMPEEVRSAVFGNVGTMITFRVGAYDAEVLEKEFMPQFTATDIVSLGRFQAYLKLMIDGVSSQPFSASTLPRIAKPEYTFRNDIIDHSRRVFARPRVEVEEEIKAWHLNGNEGKESKGEKGGKGGDRGANRGGDRGGERSGGGDRVGSDRGGRGSDRGPRGDSAGRGGFSSSGGGERHGGGFPSAGGNRSDQSRSGGYGQGPAQNPARVQSQGHGQQGVSQSQVQGGYAQGQSQSHGHDSRRDGEPHRDGANRDGATRDGANREKEMREAFSLSYLKSQKEKQENSQKVAKPENVLALRDALMSVVKESRPDIVEEIEKNKIKAEAPKVHGPHNHEPKKEHIPQEPTKTAEPAKPEPAPVKKTANEIPEDVLKKMLEVEE